MSNIDRITGPSGSPEPSKKKKEVSGEAFDELMRKDKIRETDPEEQRKRKLRHEIEEEAKAEQTGAMKSSPLKEDQTIELDAESFRTIKEKTTDKLASDRESKDTVALGEEKKAAAESKKKAVPPPSEEKVHEKAKEKEIEEQEEGIAALPLGGWEAHREKAKEEKSEAQIVAAKAEQDFLLAGKEVSFLSEAVSAAAPYLQLSAQMMDIFERMVGVMIVMTKEGIQQTTMMLDTPQFAHSLLFGSQIVITEYSTAPKAFNIEFIGNSQAVNLMQGNMEELLAAFQAGHYTFKVNRIDTALHSPTRSEGRPGGRPGARKVTKTKKNKDS